MYRYRFTETPCSLQQIPNSNTYSIVAERLCNGAWISVAVVPDVSTCQSFVSHLAQIYTRGQLDPIHLMDVIMDAIP